MSSLDPRVLRSKQSMKKALLRLIKKKHFAAISISEITEEAGLSRPTFYLHYTSKEDLLFDYYDDIALTTEKKFIKLRKKETMEIFFDSFNKKMFEEHLKNRVVMEAIFEAKLESILIKRLYDRWVVLFKDLLSPYDTSLSESAMHILVSFFLGGFVEFLKMFFTTENPPSIDQLASFHNKLMSSYIKNIMLEVSPYIDFSL